MAQWITGHDGALRHLHPLMTQDQLAAHFGVSRSCIDKRCRALGLRKGQHRLLPDTEEITERLMLDQTVRQIARELGVHRDRVIRAIKSTQSGRRAYKCNLERRGYNKRKVQLP